MTDGFTFTGEPVRTTGAVTLIEGSTFCRSAESGNLRPGSAEGLFFLDTRLLSRWELTIDGHPVEPLASTQADPHAGTFVGRVLAEGEASLLVTRRRTVGRGMREEITIRSFASEPREIVVELYIEVDFADLFEVKEGRVERARPRRIDREGDGLRITNQRGDVERAVEISFTETPVWSRDRALWIVRLEPRASWNCTAAIAVRVDGEAIEPSPHLGSSFDEHGKHEPLERWRANVPNVISDHRGLAIAVERSAEDLGALRIFDPADPDHPVIAAGAPWFMTLFGRDALLTSWMSLIVDPELALGVLSALARLQGRVDDPETEEQPGKILHEVRFAASMSTTLGEGEIYYGSVDASPLFVMLLGELRRWGLAAEEVDSLLPAADAALEWIVTRGDADGDGFVEYERRTPHGLRNQGWKDSWDGINFQDGRLAEAPIALAEAQGYVYSAFLARAHFAHETGDQTTEQHWRTRAIALRDAFNERFWLPDRGWYAVGLDRDKQPIDALASNMGHCLWTGIIDPSNASAVAERLMSPELFSGWGVRTLATSAARYDPLAYHNGSVWPHENALIAAGLMRYGFVEEAHHIILGMLDAAERLQGRLPELFAGIARAEVGTPVTYPASSSPQAWAAAAPLSFIRTLLRFDPWIPYGKLWCAPALPASIGTLSVSGIPLHGHRLTVAASADGVTIDGVPDGIELTKEPRAPLSAQDP